jgi:hypothetical protein
MNEYGKGLIYDVTVLRKRKIKKTKYCHMYGYATI